MADRKFGRVVAIEQVRHDTRLLHLELEKPATIDFVGGQYVIVHTKAEIEPGKVAKGTFTIISSEAQPGQMTLAIKQIDSGPCTTWLNNSVNVGDRLGYSGPWGAKNYDHAVGEVDALFLATDTGINTTIGFLNSKNAAACLSRARVLWLLPARDYFLDIDYVRNSLPENVRSRFRVELISDISTPPRVDQALKLVEEELTNLQPRFALLSGDGDVLGPVQQLLTDRGFGSAVTMEPYFNKPDKKDDSKKNFVRASQPELAPQPLRKQPQE
ncbi:MAG: FAD-dependent oxidoreductase [Pirellulales bacterium]|nr:FAD-dependent oxidoreductase [Pirellulales bacterium]